MHLLKLFWIQKKRYAIESLLQITFLSALNRGLGRCVTRVRKKVHLHSLHKRSYLKICKTRGSEMVWTKARKQGASFLSQTPSSKMIFHKYVQWTLKTKKTLLTFSERKIGKIHSRNDKTWKLRFSPQKNIFFCLAKFSWNIYYHHQNDRNNMPQTNMPISQHICFFLLVEVRPPKYCWTIKHTID